jgi:trimeric autotransporter adhesin
MANTLITIKKSTSTVSPASLASGELAYSYTSNIAFIGTSDGTSVLSIGGKYFTDRTNSAYTTASLAFDKANTGSMDYAYVNTATQAANTWANGVGVAANSFASATIAGANTAVGAGANNYLLAVIAGANTAVGAGANNYQIAIQNGANTAVGAGANAFTSATVAGANTAVGTGANAFTSATIAGANTAVGTGANNYLLAVIAGANTAVGAGANNYQIAIQNGANTAVGAGANAFTSATIAGANTAVGTGANNYASATFVKLTAANQTITGDLSIVGNLTLSGNTVFSNVNTMIISDPLLYLAGNNYTSDIVDIGFIANYVNASSYNVHTGIFRDSTTKEYYVFHEYNKEPENNVIDPNGNNFTIAVLNATLRTSNLILGGANAIVTINTVGTAANGFASATIAGANSYLISIIAGANTAVGGGANAFTSATIAGANTAVGTGANNYLLAVIAGANTAVGTGANNYLRAVIAGANTAVGAGANAFTSATIAGANTAVGAGANAYAVVIGNAANTNAANASYISTGTLAVAYGGTGRNTFANNGVLFGNTTSGIRVTAAGTEGQVLQANADGTPLFGNIDGGTF